MTTSPFTRIVYLCSFVDFSCSSWPEAFHLRLVNRAFNEAITHYSCGSFYQRLAHSMIQEAKTWLATASDFYREPHFKLTERDANRKLVEEIFACPGNPSLLWILDQFVHNGGVDANVLSILPHDGVVSVTRSGPRDWVLLQCAARNAVVAARHLTLQLGAQCERFDCQGGGTPDDLLREAIQQRHVGFVSFLVKDLAASRKFDIVRASEEHSRIRDGTFLHFTESTCWLENTYATVDVEVMRVLLENSAYLRARIDAPDRSGHTVLAYAVLQTNGAAEMCELLLSFGANLARVNLTMNGTTPIQFAIRTHALDVLRVCRPYVKSMKIWNATDGDSNNALQLAASSGVDATIDAVLEMIVATVASVKSKANTKTTSSNVNNATSAVQELNEEDDLDETDDGDDSTGAVTSLLDINHINAQGRSVINLLARRGCYKAIDEISRLDKLRGDSAVFREPVDFDSNDALRLTPLELAFLLDDPRIAVETVRALLSAGASLFPATLAHAVRFAVCPEILTAIVDEAKRRDMKCDSLFGHRDPQSGATAMHVAVQRDHSGTVRALFALAGGGGAAEVLLSARDNFGQTPKDVAMSEEMQEMLAQLRELSSGSSS